MGALIGGLSGLAVLLMTYLGVHENHQPPPIQEIRMEGLIGATQKSNTPGMYFPNVPLQPLPRSDYRVVGKGKGDGCAHYVALWPLPIFWVKREGGAMSWFSADAEGTAVRAAWYEAIERIPEADVMISPRVRIREQNQWALWYRRDCAQVQGKGLELNLDK